jgi:hypothetical protein
MAKRKNMKADKPEFTGRIIFDGNLQLRIPGHGIKTLRTDLAGMKLHKADPNKELLVLTKTFVGYDELHTGYIVRTKNYDDQERPCFGLKHEPDADSWTVINYCDVVAWGYADGGLNDPTLYYSCQSTVEEEIDRERRRAEKGMKTHAERLAEMEAEMEERLNQNERPDGLVVKLRDKDGNIDIETSWPKAQLSDYLPFVKEQMADCFTTFDEFRKAHPEFHEMHFMTDHTVWEKDLDEEVGE